MLLLLPLFMKLTKAATTNWNANLVPSSKCSHFRKWVRKRKGAQEEKMKKALLNMRNVELETLLRSKSLHETERERQHIIRETWNLFLEDIFAFDWWSLLIDSSIGTTFPSILAPLSSYLSILLLSLSPSCKPFVAYQARLTYIQLAETFRTARRDVRYDCRNIRQLQKTLV